MPLDTRLRDCISSFHFSTNFFSWGPNVRFLRSLSHGNPYINSNCGPVAVEFSQAYAANKTMIPVPCLESGTDPDDYIRQKRIPVHAISDYDNFYYNCFETQKKTFPFFVCQPNLTFPFIAKLNNIGLIAPWAWDILYDRCVLNNRHCVYVVSSQHPSTHRFDIHNMYRSHGNHVFNIVVRNGIIKIVDVRYGTVIICNSETFCRYMVSNHHSSLILYETEVLE